MRLHLRAAVCWSIGICGGTAICAMPPQKPGDVTTSKHEFTSKGETVPYELGKILVRENRTKPKSRLIGVGFVRLRARKPGASVPPIFLLPGGPGGSYVTRLTSARGNQRRRFHEDLQRLRAVSDVILVDQRGFSEQGDILRAKLRMPPRPADRPLSQEDRIAAFKAFARETVAEFAKTEIDLSGYNVKECAHDVAELRKALGYEKITLCGTSFGSQWSFAIMRLHPGCVARALLSGVEPLNHGYDMPSYVFAAVQRMWRTVDQNDRFKPYLPKGGIAEAARVVIERLERNPLKLEKPGRKGEVGKEGKEGKQGKGGEARTLAVLGPDDFPWNNPADILALYHGQTDRWRLRAMAGRSARTQSMRLIGPLIDTSLGVTPKRRHRLWTDPATRYLSRGNFAAYLATAEIWPSPDVGDEFRTPVLCDIPVVFAQGDWDLKTPLENTFEIAPFFTRSRVLIAERGGHGVLEPIARQLPGVWKALARFLRTGDMKKIPARVRLTASQRFAPPTFAAPKPAPRKR